MQREKPPEWREKQKGSRGIRRGQRYRLVFQFPIRELHTAGQYKRTLTLLGENTEEGREKFREELNETHQLFKDFVKRMRPSLDIEQVATGEHWYGQQAVEKGLVDEINTSDEVILSLMEGREVVNVRYMQRKRLIDRFTGSAAESADRLLLRWWQRGQKPLM